MPYSSQDDSNRALLPLHFPNSKRQRSRISRPLSDKDFPKLVSHLGAQFNELVPDNLADTGAENIFTPTGPDPTLNYPPLTYQSLDISRSIVDFKHLDLRDNQTLSAFSGSLSKDYPTNRCGTMPAQNYERPSIVVDDAQGQPKTPTADNLHFYLPFDNSVGIKQESTSIASLAQVQPSSGPFVNPIMESLYPHGDIYSFGRAFEPARVAPAGLEASPYYNHSGRDTLNDFLGAQKIIQRWNPATSSITESDFLSDEPPSSTSSITGPSSLMNSDVTVCSHCPDRVFTGAPQNRQRNLRRHIFSDHGIGPRLTCPKCSASFTPGRHDNLERHLRNAHRTTSLTPEPVHRKMLAENVS